MMRVLDDHGNITLRKEDTNEKYNPNILIRGKEGPNPIPVPVDRVLDFQRSIAELKKLNTQDTVSGETLGNIGNIYKIKDTSAHQLLYFDSLPDPPEGDISTFVSIRNTAGDCGATLCTNLGEDEVYCVSCVEKITDYNFIEMSNGGATSMEITNSVCVHYTCLDQFTETLSNTKKHPDIVLSSLL